MPDSAKRGVYYGVFLVVLSCLRLSLAGYCPVSYQCTYSCTKSVLYMDDCGFMSWTPCFRYKSVTVACSKTCYRLQCCAGYQGTACATPVCFGSTVCPNGGSCVTPDKCSCPTGYTGGPKCEDINECSVGNAGCAQYCTNTPGSFTCSCRSGFMSDGKSCQDINECSVGTAGCAQICTNTPGSFTCSCRSGFVSDGKSCQDIDECVAGSSGCSQLCNNLPGSYQCSCNENYWLEADGKSCTDCWLFPVPDNHKDFKNIIAGITLTCPLGTIFNPSICACNYSIIVPL